MTLLHRDLSKYRTVISRRSASTLIHESNRQLHKFLQCFVVTNFLCCVLFLKLNCGFLARLGIAAGFVNRLHFPAPETWEYAWTAGVFAFQLVGVLALLCYSPLLLKLHCLGIYSCIGLLLWPAWAYHQEMLLVVSYALEPHNAFWLTVWELVRNWPLAQVFVRFTLWQGLPWCIVVYGFILIAVCVHVLDVVVSMKLMDRFVEYNYAKKVYSVMEVK